MFKKLKPVLLSAAIFALAACGGGLAHASLVIANEYIDINGNLANIAMQETVTITTNQDLAALQTLPGFGSFFQIFGTTTWINLAMASSVACTGNTLTVNWVLGGTSTFTDGNCQSYQSMAGRTHAYSPVM